MKTELNGHVIALFCHGIWARGQHLGLKYIDEGPKIDRHGIAAAELATRENARLLTSGGWTRPDLYDSGVTISEAMGMKDFIQKSGTLGSNVPIITEDWARDSFENCLFSMFAFCHATGHYPERFTAVSWRFKANRILLVGNALGIPNFEFAGVENPDSRNLLHAICAETGYLASLLHYQTQTLVDPFHRTSAFEDKRQGRMPRKYERNSSAYLRDVGAAYARARGIGDAIEAVSTLKPGDGWQAIRWPWQG
jgi:hypothetical protein